MVLEERKSMRKLSSLHVYPVKSCAGHNLHTVTVGELGPNNDRRWMLIDEEGHWFTQRKCPQMALVKVAIQEERLMFIADGTTFTLEKPKRDTKRKVVVWKDTVDAYDQGDIVASWLTALFQMPCRLVYMTEDIVRPVDSRYAISPQDKVSYADGFPFLLISEASLEDLNKRLTTPLLMDRFRPNLVISGCAPYEEDTWKTIRIGTIVFEIVKPCSRCTITTVDQQTAEPGLEPLKTLATYRSQGEKKKLMFGQNLIHKNQGTLSVGDVLEVVTFGGLCPP